MSFFDSMNISASGLTAQRLRMDLIAENIANVNTTRTKDGGPYRRKVAIFEQQQSISFKNMLNNYLNEPNALGSGGVKISRVIEDSNPFKRVYDPSHPDATKDGFVLMPNVNTIEEMVNMISANRSYEANVTAINASKAMAAKALEIGK